MRMTRKELVAIHDSENVNDRLYAGGVDGCPNQYPYIPVGDREMLIECDMNCGRCWDAEVKEEEK